MNLSKVNLQVILNLKKGDIFHIKYQEYPGASSKCIFEGKDNKNIFWYDFHEYKNVPLLKVDLDCIEKEQSIKECSMEGDFTDIWSGCKGSFFIETPVEY